MSIPENWRRIEPPPDVTQEEAIFEVLDGGLLFDITSGEYYGPGSLKVNKPEQRVRTDLSLLRPILIVEELGVATGVLDPDDQEQLESFRHVLNLSVTYIERSRNSLEATRVSLQDDIERILEENRDLPIVNASDDLDKYLILGAHPEYKQEARDILAIMVGVQNRVIKAE